MLNLRSVGHVKCERRHTLIGNLQWDAGSGINPLRAPFQGFVDQRPADASIGSRDQNRSVGYIHSVRHGEDLLSSLTTVSEREKIRTGSEPDGSSGQSRSFESLLSPI